MTVLVAWIGVDSRSPSSAYIATDSRISWGSTGFWDQGRKVFASARYPDVFGYVGTVLAPSVILGQFIAAIDSADLHPSDMSLMERQGALRQAIRRSLTGSSHHARAPFAIVHVGRAGTGESSIFAIQEIEWASDRISVKHHVGPSRSAVLKLGTSEVRPAAKPLGSGTPPFSDALNGWNLSAASGTSRAVFSSLCDSISASKEPTVGGSPQLVGIWKQGPAKSFGVSFKSRLSFLGMDFPADSERDDMQCFNELFERVDQHGRLIDGAQKHDR